MYIYENKHKLVYKMYINMLKIKHDNHDNLYYITNYCNPI